MFPLRTFGNDRQHPDSEWCQSRLLCAFCTDELQGHPQRLELILDFISRFPRSSQAKCPFVHFGRIHAPEAFKSVDALWSRLRSKHPSDPDLALGHAAFVANDDRCRAAKILREAIALLPKDPALWTEFGRIAPEPFERLDALQKARGLGGPSFLLARKLCEAGMWKQVEEFLIACNEFWDEAILDDWIQEVRNEQVPAFYDV